MNRTRALALVLVVATLAGGAVGASRAAASAERADAAARARGDRVALDQDVAFFEQRVAADPIGAADRGRLAALYLQRGRETGDFADYRRAEDWAGHSLALRVAHNAGAYVVLASALLAQHRFTEALAAARALNARDPDVPSHQALLAEIELELGRYDAARVLFDSLARTPPPHDLAIAPRLARWAELTGRTDVARRLLEHALADAQASRELPREQLAWFYLRVGDFDLRHGRLAQADYALRAGLTVFPGDYRLLAALARLEAARGHWQRAIAYGQDAIAAVPDPATFGVISDAYTALDDTLNAAQYAKAMEVAVLGQPGQWHRAWSLFLLDHNRRVPEVLARVQAELATRRDVYGYDLLAWALHRAHRDHEARVAMVRALALGTDDPQLRAHAAAIDSALAQSR